VDFSGYRLSIAKVIIWGGGEREKPMRDGSIYSGQ
jgi:hypothetical protein